MNAPAKVRSGWWVVVGAATVATPGPATAWQDAPIERVVVRSPILGEDRVVLVSLPDDTTDGESVPMLVVLDAETHFDHVRATVRFLSHPRVQRMPPAVVVGIVNTDRTRDLTPTRPPEYGDDVPTAGGAGNFLDFLTEELFPALDERLGEAGPRYLIGHSFGGLFGTYALFRRPAAFAGYLLISPSLWWGSEVLLRDPAPAGLANAPPPTNVYLSVGDERGRMLAGVWRLARAFENGPGSHLRWTFERFDSETHDSVVMRAAYAGLEWLFAQP